MKLMVVLGIDVGTQGARVVACDPQGAVLAQAAESFPVSRPGQLPPHWAEQEPGTWWAAVVACLGRVITDLRRQGADPQAVVGLSVTSTSGTVLPVEATGRPLRPAMMYNDSRAQVEAGQVQAAGKAQAAALGYQFNASFALAKILWLRHHEPGLFAATHRFIHAADFIVGRLTGEYGVSDFSNALKTGYDLLNDGWPPFIETELGIPLARLPRVVKPGTPIAGVSPAGAEVTGLPPGVPVLAGMTDGCTSQISTGAMAPGDWNSTLGTTLVIKGVTERLLLDPMGRIYSHRHPDGYWLPGGASNTGGEALVGRFPPESWSDLNAHVLAVAPTDTIIYPLTRTGERFPFACPTATGFSLNLSGGEITPYPPQSGDLPAASPLFSSATRPSRFLVTDYAAHLEGVGYVERLAYETLTEIGTVIGQTIYSAGGATRSQAWSQLRADILGRVLARPDVTGGAMGAAIIAAAGVWHQGIIPATRAMVRLVEQIEPRPALASAYEERYRRFREVCIAKGYQ